MSDPAADLLSEVHSFIDDVNSGNASKALGRLVEDVCIVEDIAPFRWTGSEAGGRWLAAMRENAQRLGVSAITMTPGEPPTHRGRRGAWLLHRSRRRETRRAKRFVARGRAHHRCDATRPRALADQCFDLDRRSANGGIGVKPPAHFAKQMSSVDGSRVASTI